jgi:hypothetical protein
MSDQRALDEYDALLESVANRAPEIGDGRLASHWPHVGVDYRGLVIAGQALQGWDAAVGGARWHARDAQTADGRRAIIDKTRTWFSEAPDPVGVIATLTNRRSSPFWRLCRDIVEALEPSGRSQWYSRFAWANVYPVGPDEPPGSPGGPLKEAQDSHVGGLFAAQLDVLDARRVVVICGPAYWGHPSQTPEFESLPAQEFPLLRGGRANGRTVVVGYHPTYARRKHVRADAYATRIVETVEKIESDS